MQNISSPSAQKGSFALSSSGSSPPFSVRLGRWLFRSRDFVPVPFIILVLLVMTHRSAIWIALGVFFLLLGEGIRLWAVGTIGEKSRTRSDEVFSLVTEGPYSLSRNPLYLGNLLIGLGFTIALAPFWLLILYLSLFFLHYRLIIAFEEWNLLHSLGEPYRAYCQRVPRWFRIPPPRYLPHRWDFRRAIRSERMTLLALLLGIGAGICWILLA